MRLGGKREWPTALSPRAATRPAGTVSSMNRRWSPAPCSATNSCGARSSRFDDVDQAVAWAKRLGLRSRLLRADGAGATRRPSAEVRGGGKERRDAFPGGADKDHQAEAQRADKRSQRHRLEHRHRPDRPDEEVGPGEGEEAEEGADLAGRGEDSPSCSATSWMIALFPTALRTKARPVAASSGRPLRNSWRRVRFGMDKLSEKAVLGVPRPFLRRLM